MCLPVGSVMCLSGLVQIQYWCSPIRHVCKCLPVGSNFVCAHFCTTSVWRSPLLLSCAQQCTFSVVSAGGLNFLYVYWFSTFFLCLSILAQILYLCSPNKLRLYVSAWRVQFVMCSLLHHFCLKEPNSVILCSTMHLLCCVCRGLNFLYAHRLLCVCLDWPKVSIGAHQYATSVSVCL